MSRCRSCGARILWARTTTGKRMPLDVEYSREGNVELRNGMAHVVAVDPTQPHRRTSHFATCPNAADHRKRGS